MSKRQVYFFNRFFWPDNSATAQILTDLARGLEGQDFEVTIVTTRLSYGDPDIRYPSHESLGTVQVRRLWSTRFGRGNPVGRLMDYLTTYLSFFLFCMIRLKPSDVAVFKTDPPLLSVPGAVASSLKGFRMISWCQDIFPEVALAEMSIPKPLAWIGKVIAFLRDWSLKVSEKVIVLGTDMKDFLLERGIKDEKLLPISNWSVQDENAPSSNADLREEWGIRYDEFIVGYSGNLGRAHDWRTVLKAAEQLRDEKNLRFLCCGGGYGYEKLKEAVTEAGLTELFLFLPYQPIERLAASLKVPDIHWFTLKDRLTPFIFPSKFFGILQAGKPALFIGKTDSEIASIMAESGLGAAVAEGDVEALKASIRYYKADVERTREAGFRSREVWEARFQKSVEIDKWKELFRQLFTNNP